jgi:hypothetical protein
MRQGSARQLLKRIGWVVRHPAKYDARFGFSTFQVLLLPVLVTAATFSTRG